jgi:hypothetical protein
MGVLGFPSLNILIYVYSDFGLRGVLKVRVASRKR